MSRAASAQTGSPSPGAATSLRINNFDLLRVIAAAQVAFFHLCNYLLLEPSHDNPLVAIAHTFPGVPVFFVVSGFLISLSWEKNPDLREYMRNRALRIFPALWVCLVVSIVLAVTIGHVDFLRREAIPWLLAQVSFAQFYTPDFLRGYGVGTLNGSLWTIPIELQFYLLLPILYRLSRTKEGNVSNWLFVALFVGSAIAQYLLRDGWNAKTNTMVQKLLIVSIIPHLWMFIIGVLLQRNYQKLAPWIAGKGGYWFLFHLAVAWVVGALGGSIGVNSPNPVAMVVTGITVIALAFTAPGISHRVLRGNDVSYGLYIYHGVVLNVFVVLGLRGTWRAFAAAFGLSAVLAVASWVLVERPTLRFKRKTIKAV